MKPPEGAALAEVSTWLSIVSKLFGTRMAALLEPHGLTPGQFSILHHVTRPRIDRAATDAAAATATDAGGARVSDIAAAVEVEQPAVTKTLAKFQNMGVVEMTSDPKDKRARIVTATPKAGQLLAEIYRDIGPDLARVFGTAIDPSELEDLTRLLRNLGQWLDRNRLR